MRPLWPVTLRAGAIVLRPMRRADGGRWTALRASNRAWLKPWDPTPPPAAPSPPPTFVAMLRAYEREARADRMLPWAIGWDAGWPHHRQRDGRVPIVGQLTVAALQWGSARSAQVGYWVDQGHAGRGIVPAAVGLACDYAFGVLALHRIEICIRPENTNSLRVVEKLGLRREGRRPAYLHINGQWADHEVFAVHADEAADGMLVRLLAGGPLPSHDVAKTGLQR